MAVNPDSTRPDRVESLSAFPTLHGRSLAGVDMQLPDDLEGELNLIFVAFHQRHQLTINRWIRELGPLEDTYRGLALYEIPLMVRFPAFYRNWIDRGMKAGIPDPKTRTRTVTVYTDRSEFLQSVGLGGTSEIWVVAADRSGTVFWSHVGGFSEKAAESLTWTLERLTIT